MRMRPSPCGLPRTRTRKCVPAGPGIQDLAAPVARRQPIGGVALADERRQARRSRIVGADHDQSVERHLVGEVQERGGQRRLGAEVVQVLAIDVGHHRDHREQVAERAVGLVGLGDQDLAATEARVGPERARLAADDRRRIQPGVREDDRNHRRGRRLAVAARHRDAVLDAHQLAQHLGARDHRDVARARGQDLRVVGAHGAGHDDDVGARGVLGAVADADARAQRRQPARDVALAPSDPVTT